MKINWSAHTNSPEDTPDPPRDPMTGADVGYLAVLFVGTWILVGFIVWAVWSNL